MSKNRLKQLREQRGLSLEKLQNELKNKVDLKISSDSLSRYELFQRNPKPETWKKLADFYGVSVPYLQGAYSKDEIEKIIVTELNNLHAKLKEIVNNYQTLEDVKYKYFHGVSDVKELNLKNAVIHLIKDTVDKTNTLSSISLAIYELKSARNKLVHGVKPSTRFRVLVKSSKRVLELNNDVSKNNSLEKNFNIWLQILAEVKTVIATFEDSQIHNNPDFIQLMETIPFKWLTTKPGLDVTKDEIINLAVAYSTEFIGFLTLSTFIDMF